jgi:hypothetical protein
MAAILGGGANFVKIVSGVLKLLVRQRTKISQTYYSKQRKTKSRTRETTGKTKR